MHLLPGPHGFEGVVRLGEQLPARPPLMAKARAWVGAGLRPLDRTFMGSGQWAGESPFLKGAAD